MVSGFGIEFYLAIPFVLVYRIRWPVFFMSVTVFLLARYQVLDPHYFSYRLLSGTYLFALIFVIQDVINELIALTDYNRQCDSHNDCMGILSLDRAASHSATS